MKKLIEKIKSWFNKKEPTDVNYIFNKCDELAKKYGTRCSSISINKSYYPNSNEIAIILFLHTLHRSCESIRFESEIDVGKVLATWELMLIKDYGKIKNM